MFSMLNFEVEVACEVPDEHHYTIIVFEPCLTV